MIEKRDRGLYVLFSLPKSGAQAYAAALDEGFVPQPFGKHYPPAMSDMDGLHVEIPMSRAILGSYPDGGWIHTHAAFSFASADALAKTQTRYVVMVRNPLDQLAAYYCHIRKHLSHHGRVPGHPRLIFAVPMAACRHDVFRHLETLDEAFAHLIRDGYLEACLRWIADWMYFREEARSLVVRYEDFVQSTARTLFQAQSFLPEWIAFDGDKLASAFGKLDAYKQNSFDRLEDSASFYPRGWTGSVGIRSRYLTPELEAEAIETVRRFSRTYPLGASVAALYPEFAGEPAQRRAG